MGLRFVRRLPARLGRAGRARRAYRVGGAAEALAYATIAGVSSVVGLYAAPPALVLYAARVLGSTSVTGPMAATAALSAAAAADPATGGPDNFAAFTALLAIATGVLAPPGRLVPAGLPGQLHLRAGVEGVHHRPGVHDCGLVSRRKVFGPEKGEGDFFEQAAHFLRHLGEHPVAHAGGGAASSFVIVMAPRPGGPRLSRASLVAVAFCASGPCSPVRSGPPRRGDRRPHPERASRRSGSRTS